MVPRIILSVLVVTSVLSVVCTDPTVDTSYGKIRGKFMKSEKNKTFAAFQGVPFAKPPVGELRFQPPQHPDYWEGILDDRNSQKRCIQVGDHHSPYESEDCLYLNVYTPQLPEEDRNSSLPVIFYIHGGAFVEGSASIDEQGPQYLMDYDVIVVVTQYRLGFLGFLSTEDMVCPGNNGLKDQQFAIRWAKENIRNFGGDPDRITLFGESAGGASVAYQLLGSNAEGLFRGVIQNSGSSLSSWALQRNPRQLAFQFGNYINPAINETNTTSAELIDFFRTVETSTIVETCVALFGEGLVGGFYTTFAGYVFSGVVEPEHDGAFLTDTAFNKFESGNFNVVPILMGINSEEALFLLGDLEFHERMVEYDNLTELLVPPDMHIADQDISREVGEYIREIYVGSGLLQDNLGPSIKYFSDGAFCRASLKQAELASHYTNVYLYEFAYTGELGGDKNNTYIPGAGQVAHGVNMAYIFHTNYTGDLSTYPKEDIRTMERLLTMWTNFAKYLNPTPEPVELLQNVTWPNIESTNKIPYLLINETLEVKYDLKKPMMDEYKRLFDTYAIPPLDTY